MKMYRNKNALSDPTTVNHFTEIVLFAVQLFFLH